MAKLDNVRERVKIAIEDVFVHTLEVKLELDVPMLTDDIMIILREVDRNARIDELNNLIHNHQQIVRKGKVGTVAVCDDAVLSHDIKRRISTVQSEEL